MGEKERVIQIITKQIYEYSERLKNPFSHYGNDPLVCTERIVALTGTLGLLYPDEFSFVCNPNEVFEKAYKMGSEVKD